MCVFSVAGVMVSIAAFQAVDPGSIPGPRSFEFKKGGDARIELATSCTLNHTTRPITRLYVLGDLKELDHQICTRQ